MAEESTVHVGKKPAMSYVLAVITQFNNSATNEVVIKARGKSISRAVDVAEIVRNRFMQDVSVKDIVISTEQLERDEGTMANVSSIEIFLSKSSAEK